MAQLSVIGTVLLVFGYFLITNGFVFITLLLIAFLLVIFTV